IKALPQEIKNCFLSFFVTDNDTPGNPTPHDLLCLYSYDGQAFYQVGNQYRGENPDNRVIQFSHIADEVDSTAYFAVTSNETVQIAQRGAPFLTLQRQEHNVIRALLYRFQTQQ